MRGESWVFLIASVFALGLYLISGETVVERYGWFPLVAVSAAYVTYVLSRKIDELDRRVARLEGKQKDGVDL